MPTDTASVKRGYHHANPKAALIAATDAILRDRCIEPKHRWPQGS